MKHLDRTLPSPAENLACDEALLDWREENDGEEILRFWESPEPFVVVGYANRLATEVHLPFCRRHTIPVLRRCTGGGTVLQGPGVLNYSLVLRIDADGPAHSISSTNTYILKRHQDALAALLRAPVEMRGQTDLAIGGLKFCGNAQRRRKRFLLFHGSFLLHFDIDLLERVLPMPSRQPDYRLNRPHSEFLMNLRVGPDLVKGALLKAWDAEETASEVPFDQIYSLAQEKYGTPEWNMKF